MLRLRFSPRLRDFVTQERVLVGSVGGLRIFFVLSERTATLAYVA
jgi:hypothetical protein